MLDEQQLGGYKFGEIVEITIGEGDTLMSELLDKVGVRPGRKYIGKHIDILGNILRFLSIASIYTCSSITCKPLGYRLPIN